MTAIYDIDCTIETLIFSDESATGNTPQESGGPRIKKFNLGTYKFHAMGDYARTIKFFGTTDSFTTQMVGTICG
jgi:hypothetical protein